MKNGLRQLCRAALVLVLAMIGLPLVAGPAGAADGVGTMTVSPTYLVSSSTGNGLSFTYTAAGTMTNGILTILVPTAFPTPTASGFDPSGVQNLCSGDSPAITSVAGGHLVTITSVSMTVGSTCQINYGLPGFSGGFTAPAASATYAFTTQQRSNNSSGALTNVGSSPQVVVGDSGTGAMTVSPLHVVNTTAATTLTFTYTAARAMSSGKLELDVPAGWSAPSTTASAPGYTTASCGTVGVASSTISVSGITLASAATCTVTYGSKASGGPGATTPTNGGINTFTVRHAANNSATPVEIGTFPKVSVTAPDGAGTITASPTTIISGSTGNGISFTYAPGAGGTDNGSITILVPTAFPTPTNSGFDPAGVQNLCSGDSPAITSVAGGHLITITSVTIAANATCQVNYGLPGFSGGWTAPAGSSTNVFTTSEKSYTSGALTALGTSPTITVGTDGTGTMTIAPPHAVAGSTGNTETLTYTAATSISSGIITVDVPAGWSAPSTTTSAPGYTTSNCGTVAVAAQKVTVSGVTKAAAATCTVVYGSKASAGPGATAPSTGGGLTFTTQEKSSAGGTLTTLSNGSPKVSVTAADGAGTITATPTSIISGSTGNGISFSYTATAGGMDTGTITILVPTAFPTPTNSGFDPAGVQNLCSGDSPAITSVVGGHLITITSISLAPNANCQINYGLPGFSGGWTAPSGTSTNVFTTSEQSYSSGALVALAASPTVTVTADGTGTMAIAPTHAVAGTSGKTETLTYTAAVAMSSGTITVDVPAGWSAPSTTTSNPGYTTSTCGTVGVAGQKITISAVTKAAAATCTITYGSTASGGPGATTPSTGGSMTFTTQQKAGSGGSLITLSKGSPSVSVTAADGTGTMSVSPTALVSASTGNDLAFTYTATAGGLDNGTLTILVPTAFPTPTNSGFDPSGVANLCSGDSPAISSVAGGHLITITSVSLAPNANCQVKYGNAGFSGGWTAPAGTSTYSFTASEASAAAGVVTGLAGSPSVSLVQDGSGTMTVSPPTTSASSMHNTLAFTYTAGFPMSAGEVTIDIPAGWSVPSVTGTAAGFSTTDCPGATVSTVGSTIHVSNLTLAAAASCTVTYGDTVSGGPAATAGSSTGTITFNAKQKSSAGGTLTPIGTSPHLTVYAADGTGTFTVAPSTAVVGATAQTLTFTYTAATGGMSGGRIELTVPTGWSVPSTTATAAGRTTSTCASVTIATRTIQLTNVGLAADGTCTITYGDKTGGGTGATAPATLGASTFAASQKSSGPGALAAVATSPSVTVTPPGGIPPTPNHTLTVTVTGSGSITGPGIACPGTCTKTAVQGSTVALTATPARGWALTSWGNAGCPGPGVCNIALNTDETVAAVFQQLAVCTVKPTSPKVKVPAKGKKGKPTLTVVVTCSQAVTATLSGKATETFTVKTTVKGKTKLVKKTVIVAFAGQTKKLKAKTKTSYIVNVPAAVMNALKLKRATSVTFTLKVKNAIGPATFAVKIKQLKR